MTKKFMVIDGNSIMNRAFYGLQSANMLSTAEGLYTNAIYGFLNILFKYREEEKPDYIAIAFDLKAPTFRHNEYSQYKANRKGMPPELRVQVPVLKEVIDALSIKRIEMEGYEADDILGTISNYCNISGLETVIVTGDKDSLQLITDKTKVKLPLTRGGQTETHEFTIDKFREVYEIEPKQFIDVKGIMGDKSDNIPGIPGVGEKTALKLIKEYKDVETILQNINELNVGKSTKQKIADNMELATLSKRLATIELNVPININLDDYEVCDFDKEKLYELFIKLEFNSFIKKLGLKGTCSVNIDVVLLQDEDKIDDLINSIKSSKIFVYDLVHEFNNKLNIIGIGILHMQNAYYIPLNEKIIRKFKSIFENDKIEKHGYDIKPDIVSLNSLGIEMKNIGFDALVASYILNASREIYSLSSDAIEYLGQTIDTMAEFFGIGSRISPIKELTNEQISKYIGIRVNCISRLIDIFKKKIEENNQHELYYKIELPLVEVLANMEIEGFKVDKKQLTQLSNMLDERINLLNIEIYKIAGEEFNINSPKQLGVILFDKIGLPVIKKTKTGYSTNAEVLEMLKHDHEIIGKILEYRQLIKLKTTYADGLLHVYNEKTGKIHSSFNQTVTQTGRISSTEPNLQNIPVRLELGREFRKVFIARDNDHVLLDADYSQIELRVLAHIADDINMKTAFMNNEDIHTKTASQVFNVPYDEVTSIMRSRAKAVNFGIVYGIGEFSLSKDLGISRKEAKEYIENYLDNFTGVRNYMKEIVEFGKIQGFVTTLLNRRRYLPELKSSNFNIRSFGERIAMNTPIQGTAADIIKIAMVNVYNQLKSRNLRSKLILQVHDELIIDTHKDEIDIVKEILYKEMTGALKLDIKLTIDSNMGYSWYDAK